jgi:hypothetical protein
MKQAKYMMTLAIGALLAVSCNKKIQSLETNPNYPTSVPSSLILGTVLADVAGQGSQGSLGGDGAWGSVQQWNQYHCQNYNYYGNNIYSWTAGSSSFDPYLVMKNVYQMDQEWLTRGGNAVNAYEAVGRFIDAYYYYNLTSMYGDIPQSQALGGTTNLTPTYTPQDSVFLYVLNQLDTANTHLAQLIAAQDNSLSPSQDIFYAGDLSKWQMAVNTFKLRVLLSLSKQASNAMLNVPAQFANIYNNPSTYPIFADSSDDMEYAFNPGGSNSYNTYPFNPSNFGSIAGRFNMAATYVSALTAIGDPRVFVTCEPAWGIIKTAYDSLHPAQFQFFVGASTGETIGDMYANASAGLYSFINRNRYYSNFTGEPQVILGYKEMLFNIAEAIERGWITGTAETFYLTGIEKSMSFYGINTALSGFNAWFLPPGGNSVTQVQPYPVSFDFSTWYAQPAVKLSAIQTTAINQIVLQKYITCFENSGYEGYYNWRRTGVPAFQGGNGVGNNGVVPVRWAYPITEESANEANWQKALSNQQYSADDLNQTMWLLK